MSVCTTNDVNDAAVINPLLPADLMPFVVTCRNVTGTLQDSICSDDDPVIAFRQLLEQNNILLVGVSGKIGSGKSTLCEQLHEQEPFRGRTLVRNFADLLKETASQLLSLPLELFYSQEGKNIELPLYGMTIGRFLQQYGCKMREIDPDFWVKGVQLRVKRMLAELATLPLLVTIGDVRFENEIQWIHKCGGICIRLDGDPAGERAISTRDLNHISETALDNCHDFDLTIDTQHADKQAMCQIAQWYLGHVQQVRINAGRQGQPQPHPQQQQLQRQQQIEEQQIEEQQIEEKKRCTDHVEEKSEELAFYFQSKRARTNLEEQRQWSYAKPERSSQPQQQQQQGEEQQQQQQQQQEKHRLGTFGTSKAPKFCAIAPTLEKQQPCPPMFKPSTLDSHFK